MILQGNSIRIPLADNSVNCVITSPPYWNLRDYGTARWEGGSIDCDHKTRPSHNIVSSTLGGGKSTTGHWQEGYRDTCPRCGAVRIDNQIGLEPTIAEYIAVIVQVFREVKRVLHPTGIAWVNLGDTYATSRNGRSAADTKAVGKDDRTFRDKPFSINEVPAKNLCLIPQRVALALQDDGWIVRSFIPWIKGNPMPESVEDRPGTAHEYIIMLVKSERYYFDTEGVRRVKGSDSIAREKRGVSANHKNTNGAPGQPPHSFMQFRPNDPTRETESGRALRTSDFFNDSLDAYIAHLQSIRDNGGMMLNTEGLPAGLVINSAPYKFAHYATFPSALIRPMILAATSARGVCPKCGKGWVRVSESTGHVNKREPAHVPGNCATKQDSTGWQPTKRATDKWQPTCSCNAGEPIPGIILDPFCGSGTVGQVARELGRRFIGIDLSATYLIENALPRAEMKTSEKAIGQLPMFAQMESA